jgi:hypothetical protein
VRLDERDFYWLNEMSELMGITEKALKNRIFERRNHPPVHSPAPGRYQFPKKEYVRWRDARTVKAIA